MKQKWQPRSPESGCGGQTARRRPQNRLETKTSVAAQKAVLARKLNAAVRHGTDIGMNALSIRQPYVEQILQGTKRIEFRSMPTRITGQVLLYASLTPGPAEEFAKMRMQPGDLPTGKIVAAVDIVGCHGRPGDYQWQLANPLRLRKPVAPKNHPQPAWFKPF